MVPGLSCKGKKQPRALGPLVSGVTPCKPKGIRYRKGRRN